jgi:outer membrane protein
MKQFILLLLASFGISLYHAYGQEVWDLERCVRVALENSLNVQNAQIGEQFSLINVSQAKQARLPSLNANAGAGLNFGRKINPATNDFETENTFFSDMGISSGVALYQGGLLYNSVKQAGLDLDAAREDIRQTKSSLALQVALSYLNVLFADENLENARAKLSLSQAQLEQIEKMINAGTRPESDRYDVLAQIALDEQDIVRFKNDHELNMLSLKHLMLLEPDYPVELSKPELSLDGMEAFETYALSSVYSAALTTQPQIKAQEKRIQSAQVGEQIAKAGYLPRLSIGGSIGTNYSDVYKTALGYETIRIPTQGVYINGESALFEVEREFATGVKTTPVFDQFDNNLGYGVSMNLTIPIYNNSSAKSSLSRARLTTEQQKLNDVQIRQTLKTDIQNALAAARAGREALEASERAFTAAEMAYRNADRRFALGTINNYDLISARNRLDAARVNRTIAKYDYLFRAKVIEYYLGRGLTLN